MLLESFKLRVDWVIHVLHVPLFEREFDQFWSRLKQGSKEGKQPPISWISARLAVILAVLALGLHFAPHSSPDVLRICEDPAGLALQLVDGAERALAAANWAGKPQVRSVQAILLIAWFYWSIGELDRLIVWVGAAARIAQSLGLHSVSSPKNTLKIPASDFDIPGNGKLFREQLACRLWWTLCSLDWDISYRCRNTTVIRVGDFTTPVPDNYTDEDLLDDARQPRKFDQPTASSYQIVLAQLLQFIQQWKQPRRLPLAQQHITHVHLSYDTVVKLHDTLHERSRKLPPFFRFDYAGGPLPLSVELQRLQFQKDIHVRLVRVTRRYLFAGRGSPEHESTRSQSRAAATKLLQLIGDLCSRIDYAGKLWWIGGYTLQASAVLLASNIHGLANFTNVALAVNDIDVALDHVKTALARLHQVIYDAPPQLVRHIEQCARIIGALVVEENYARIARTQMRFDHMRHSRMLDVVTKATMSCSEDDAGDLKTLADEYEAIAVELTHWLGGGTPNVGLSDTAVDVVSSRTGVHSNGVNHALSTLRTTSTEHVPLLAASSFHHVQHSQDGTINSGMSAYADLPAVSSVYLSTSSSNPLSGPLHDSQHVQHQPENAAATTTTTTTMPIGFTSMTDYDDFFRSLGFSAPLDNTFSDPLADGVSPNASASAASTEGQYA
ncbi:hypothetical protein OIV83_006472 [Microbotryomycetes sp. JL201]|nr:hypothetical protein OIV83_006472 [Microbotryomycetes sp. JL201]